MVQQDIGLITAFIAGFASFISPCVLPLVPAYLSFMSGVSLADLQSGGDTRKLKSVLAASLAFVGGFSLVFILMGASASVIGQKLLQSLPVLARIAGALLIVLGVHMAGILRIPFLSYERRVQAGGGAGLITSFVTGLAFAFGWTPCIGPILAAILALAASTETVSKGILLLAVYSAGLGLPFILAGLFLKAFYGFFGRIQVHFHKIEIVSGLVLIAVGVLLVANKFTLISGYLSRLLPTESVG
jgi:cytochrome c-type biogenesis protein